MNNTNQTGLARILARRSSVGAARELLFADLHAVTADRHGGSRPATSAKDTEDIAVMITNPSASDPWL